MNTTKKPLNQNKMKTAELVKKCQDRMKSIRDKIETKRKSKKVYSEEEARDAYNVSQNK